MRNNALPNPSIVIQGDGLPRRPVVVFLVDGPCEGTHTTVLGFGKSLWQRVPGRTPFWAKYMRSARGEYSFAGDIIDLVGMAEKIAAQGRGNVIGSHGA